MPSHSLKSSVCCRQNLSLWRNLLIVPCVALAYLVLFVAPAATAAETEWTSLFDGKSLAGWTQRGGTAEYHVENGEIVGVSVPNTPNSFLCTDRDYENFILEVDFFIDPLLNSGIQIRSQVSDAPLTYVVPGENDAEKTIVVPPGRVHGYQVEIDTSPRAWTGGIYDEGRRGWLFPLQGDSLGPARSAFQLGEWNSFRVEAVGPRIRTWVNGVPAADLHDDLTPAGLIALQVHGIGDSEAHAGKKIRWKNIRIREVDAPPAVGAFFPGVDGPGQGKSVVLIAGDEEYRSEEALPQLAKILSRQHGFDCQVLFSVDPKTGFIHPNVRHNIPGLEALETADVLVLFTRFRELPDDQMQHIDRYLLSGKPVLGIRTATHAFKFPSDSPWARYSFDYSGELAEWKDGFGRLVLGETWHTHHGHHRHQSTRGRLAAGMAGSPFFRGIDDCQIWGPTDVYGIRLPMLEGVQPLALGEVIHRAGEYDAADLFFGLRPEDSEPDETRNNPLMPVIWRKPYQLPDGAPGESITSTIGASVDMLNDGVRRALVHSVYLLTGLENSIPAEGASVDLVGEFKPTRYESHPDDYWQQLRMTPADQTAQ